MLLRVVRSCSQDEVYFHWLQSERERLPAHDADLLASFDEDDLKHTVRGRLSFSAYEVGFSMSCRRMLSARRS